MDSQIDKYVPNGDIVIYQTEDGKVSVDVVLENETVWLTQEQIAALYGKSKSTISYHLTNIFQEQELDENVVVRYFRTTTQHGAIAGKTGSISADEARAKAISEYRKYQVRALTPVEQAYSLH